MVWMPTLGVWAAAGQGASQQAEKPAAVRTDQLQHSRQDSPSAGLLPIKRKAEDRQRAMASAELAEQGTHHQHHHHHRQPHHARHRPEQLAEVQQVQQQQQQGYTGFDLQEQTSDREASEVEVEEEEHELPPTCPICERAPAPASAQPLCSPALAPHQPPGSSCCVGTSVCRVGSGQASFAPPSPLRLLTACAPLL